MQLLGENQFSLPRHTQQILLISMLDFQRGAGVHQIMAIHRVSINGDLALSALLARIVAGGGRFL